MAYQIIKKKRFTNQLYKLLDYLEKEWGTKIAADFFEKVENHFKWHQNNPNLGTASTKTIYRSILITPHNRIVYRISGNKIIVVAMYDTRMNPKKNRYK